jgi:hypothetical protein
MKTYRALVQAQVQNTVRAVPAEVRAMSSSDAKWLLQVIYGFHAVVSTPVEVKDLAK